MADGRADQWVQRFGRARSRGDRAPGRADGESAPFGPPGGEGVVETAPVTVDAAGLAATLRFKMQVEFHWPVRPVSAAAGCGRR